MNKKIVVLIPVYNPNEKIMKKFLDELSKNFENIVFINDGCSKKYDKFMDNIAKKLCRDYVRTRERKHRFCGMGAAKMSVAVAVGHVSGCERWLTVPPLGRFRLADGHLWRCEKASFATPNTQNYQPNIAPTMQPADRQSVTKTR